MAKNIDTTLTEQELQSAYLARHDLGPGYPQLAVSEYVRRLYLDTTAVELSLKFAPSWTPSKQEAVDNELNQAVRQLLSIDDEKISVHPTFSGSIALDRAFSAVQRIARWREKESLVVITTTPCIDIMKLFLQERSDVRTIFVPSNKNGCLGAIDTETFIETVKQLSMEVRSEHIVVLITSPENPTGAVWSAESLKQLGAVCANSGATLFIDHTFALAGVHDASGLPMVWDALNGKCQWISIWDTGKTFGLNEDKLGFVISGNDEVCRAVESSLAVLQFGVARRAKIFFTELFRLAKYYDHVSELRGNCLKNYEYLCSVSNDTFRPLGTGAGSLVLVDIGASGMSDEEVRIRLLNSGIGVIAGNVFFHSDWRPRNLIRVALARRQDYFQEAVEKIFEALP